MSETPHVLNLGSKFWGLSLGTLFCCSCYIVPCYICAGGSSLRLLSSVLPSRVCPESGYLPPPIFVASVVQKTDQSPATFPIPGQHVQSLPPCLADFHVPDGLLLRPMVEIWWKWMDHSAPLDTGIIWFLLAREWGSCAGRAPHPAACAGDFASQDRCNPRKTSCCRSLALASLAVGRTGLASSSCCCGLGSGRLL